MTKTLTKQTQKRNQKLMLDIINYLQKRSMFSDVNIYCNNHKYSSEETKDAVPLTSKNGTYYDCGEWDVGKQIEYCNPDILTMTFEGPLYHDYNYYLPRISDCHAEADIQKICSKYGLYPEQGYAWSLAVYE